MFKEERSSPTFNWSMIGDIKLGRPNLGPTTTVATYRLMQFTLRDILIKEVGVEKTDRIFYEAGETAGREFHQNVLKPAIPAGGDFNDYVVVLQNTLKELKIGIVRVEKADVDKLIFTLTVAEDLDCSGMPVCGEEICTYDEGFISGLLTAYTNQKFRVKEVDCWCSGDRVCRFEIVPV